MPLGHSNTLITGLPGVGKTTLVRRLCDELQQHRPAGFYTEEIRESGVRRGFALVGLDGSRDILAHVDIAGKHRVGKYGVDVGRLDTFLERLALQDPRNELVVLDEIGKMECCSSLFVDLVRSLLDSERTVLATIALKGGGLMAEVKQRPDVRLFTVTRHNRDTLGPRILGEEM